MSTQTAGDAPTAEPETPKATLPDLRFRGRCEHLKGAGDLSRYPNLVYAPAQWGDGVRTHLKGVSVEFIAESSKGEDGSNSLVAQLDDFAKLHDISFDELLDALRYARSVKLV